MEQPSLLWLLPTSGITSRDKSTGRAQAENLSLIASLFVNGTFLVTWLCADDVSPVQEPHTKSGKRLKNRKRTGKTLSIPCYESCTRLAHSYLLHPQQRSEGV